MMFKKMTLCQSCGMPLSQDPQKGGTETDGTKSQTYCSYCYVDGKFTFNGTLAEYKILLKDLLQKQGFSRLKTWFCTQHLKRLDRWKKQ